MKYIKFLFLTFLMTFIIFESIVFGIICYPKDVYQTNYCSLIQEKFEILKETNEPKIIVVSGSSSSFGLDQAMLEEATGYKVANLGLHAGFGALFHTELAKANINKGDIVLLGYEYGWETENGFDYLGADLIMAGIDDNIEMYSYLPPERWNVFLGYLFDFAAKKNKYIPESGIYSREAFDPTTGQMIMARDYTMEYDPEVYGTIDLTNVTISENSIEYLKDFKQYVEDRGARVYFIAPPLIADSVVCDYSEFTKLKELEEEKIGIEYISDPIEYLFPEEWMSNALYHCNSTGEDIRTQMLIDDLNDAGVTQAD